MWRVGKSLMSKQDPGVAHERMRLPLREEAIGDAALVEHLDGAGVQAPGSRSVELLTGASFDDDDVDPRQRQLGRQHQSRRTASGDHHRMLGHAPSPISVGSGPASQILCLTVPGARSTAAPHTSEPVRELFTHAGPDPLEEMRDLLAELTAEAV